MFCALSQNHQYNNENKKKNKKQKQKTKTIKQKQTNKKTPKIVNYKVFLCGGVCLCAGVLFFLSFFLYLAENS